MDLRIEKLVAGGEGLGFIDGKAVFVRGVLPGERVRVRLRQSRRDYEKAALQEILEPSAHRVTPPCPLAGTCGGCDWMHISYEEQLAQKLAVVREALRRTGGLDEEPALAEGALQIVASPPLASRTRAQVHRDAAGRLGFMGVRSDRVVPAAACPAAAPGVEAVLRDPARAPSDLDRFTVAVHDAGVAVEGRDDDADLTVSICGLPISFSVGCFFQSNLALLDGMVSWALEGRGAPGERAADLYAGVGLFGAHLAARGAAVTCIESSAMAVAYARRNLRGAGHEFFPMSVESWIVSGAAQAEPGFDTVVVDPPRPGLSPDVTAWLRATPPRALSYVSCNPVTLARDLGALLDSGFTLESLRLFDFYPQTSHVEAVARLRGPT